MVWMKGLGPEIQGFEGPLEQAYRFDEIGIVNFVMIGCKAIDSRSGRVHRFMGLDQCCV